MMSHAISGSRPTLPMNKPAQLSADRQKLLAQRLKGIAKAKSEAPQIARLPAGTPAPLSIGQHPMWVIDRMAPGNPAYNIATAYRIGGELNVQALEASFNKIIERHDALRTTFRDEGREPVQVVHPELKIAIEVTDLASWPLDGREAKAKVQIADEALKPFDLEQLPLIRVSLCRLAPLEHVLVINQHHIIGDGLSVALLFNELNSFYLSLTKGTEAQVPNLPVQYPDFAAWQKTELSKERYASQLEYWKGQLGGSLPVLELPTDRVRPIRQSFQGSCIDFLLPQPLAQAVNALGTQHQATFFVTALAAFQVLLMRYTRTQDVIIGMPIANRPLPETDPLIGNFINVVALRGDLSGNPTFVDLLRRSRETTLNAVANKETPFDEVVKNLQTSRDPSRNPIFQVLFQVLPSGKLRLGELKLSRFEFETRFAQVDLTLHLYEEADGSFHGQVQYCTDLYTPGTIERLARNFIHLLTEVTRDPQQKIEEIPVVSEPERRELTQDWNATSIDYPSEASLQAIFERQAAQTPDAVAIEHGRERWTYRDLDERANRLARHLQRSGLQPGACAAICMERSPELIAGLLAILKAGGAYVPLDTASPADRLALMVEESRSVLVLTRSSEHSSFDQSAVPVINYDRLDLSQESTDPLGIAGTGTDAAYVIFTSGSTGKPKGVTVPHRGVARLVVNSDYVPFEAADVVAHASNVAFDAATFEVWGALLNGGKLVIVPRDTLLSNRLLATLLEQHQITTLFLTTSLFNQVATESPALFRSVKNVVFGGEAGNPDCVRRVLDHGAPRRLVNGYGPTETTTFAICHVVRELSPDATSVPIGRPITNTTAFILDSHQQLVPCGAIGEIYLGGPGLAIGYCNDAALTAERFVETSWGRLYRTGDLGRRRDDGIIEYAGRMDSQLKIRGYRIEPGEIETALRHHPLITQAAVVPQVQNGTAQGLIAYLVSPSGEKPAAGMLREYLSPHLPSYMIPSAFVWMDALPLTPNGKLDVRALPAAEVGENSTQGFAPAENDLQRQLVEIWEEVLDRRPIGIRDDFFSLGGHSLLAARIISQVSSRLGLILGFGTFFNRPTIEEHALSLNAAQSPEPESQGTILNAEGSQTPVFFFHGDLLGGGFFSKTIASALGTDRPFHVMAPHGVQGEDIPATLEGMAAARFTAIRKAQPHGPYIVGGYCNGALIAYHTARLLRDVGEQVTAVLMLSADGSNARFRGIRRLVAIESALRGEDEGAQRRRFLRLRNRLCDYEAMRCYYYNAAADLWKQPFKVQISRLARKARRILRRLSPPAVLQLVQGVAHPDNTEPTPRHKEAIVNAYDDVIRVHIPSPLDSPVFLFCPESEPAATWRGPAAGWKELCPELELVTVPGDHTSCVALNANVAQVGEAMRKSIQKAESLLKERES